MKLPLGRIAHILNAAGSVAPAMMVQGYSIDTRTIQAGELFFAVKGERFDGHDFVEEALGKGAAAAVVSSAHGRRYARGSRLFIVEDTLAALQKLASATRRWWGKPLIAITGSAGKTTTKEMIAQLLATRYRTLKSEGNLNNHFGLPLQLLRLDAEHDIAVVEMGMNHAGEIAALARLAAPDTGVVTNVAPVHLGFFESVAGIAQAKKELIDALPGGAAAVLNADDAFVSRFGDGFRGQVITYGINESANVRAESIQELGLLGSRFRVAAGADRQTVALPLLGRHSIYNALAAVATALTRGIELTTACAELARLRPAKQRGEISAVGGVTIINDCYNSNPKALDAMVDALAQTHPGPHGRRIVVAGDMLELGPASEQLHRACGEHIAESGIDALLGVGALAKFIVEGARRNSPLTTEWFTEPESAGQWLARQTGAGDIVLLKASRGVALERALAEWTKKQ